MLGFLFSYGLFTTILFFVLNFFKESSGISFFSVLGITVAITVLGLIIKKLLE